MIFLASYVSSSLTFSGEIRTDFKNAFVYRQVEGNNINKFVSYGIGERVFSSTTSLPESIQHSYSFGLVGNNFSKPIRFHFDSSVVVSNKIVFGNSIVGKKEKKFVYLLKNKANNVVSKDMGFIIQDRVWAKQVVSDICNFVFLHQAKNGSMVNKVIDRKVGIREEKINSFVFKHVTFDKVISDIFTGVVLKQSLTTEGIETVELLKKAIIGKWNIILELKEENIVHVSFLYEKNLKIQDNKVIVFVSFPYKIPLFVRTKDKLYKILIEPVYTING